MYKVGAVLEVGLSEDTQECTVPYCTRWRRRFYALWFDAVICYVSFYILDRS